MKITRLLAPVTTAVAASVAVTAPAEAHIGHLGEVAGHGHWVAVAAAAAAAAIAAALALKARKRDTDSEEDTVEADADDAETAAS
ncbi:MAG: hypothetical protein KDJ16_06515 [Hyphomicrobiales bacterium]|nr:hypothetical protein [Hyphomicrobiales bacterium]